MRGGRCGEFDRVQGRGALAGAAEARWREHLAGCADCRAQARADALLRGSLDARPPELSPGFDAGLRRELERRAAVPRPGRLRPSVLWALGAYVTAGAVASAAILARLPWETLAPSPALAIAVGALALLSPLALLDRLGVVRPPG